MDLSTLVAYILHDEHIAHNPTIHLLVDKELYHQLLGDHALEHQVLASRTLQRHRGTKSPFVGQSHASSPLPLLTAFFSNGVQPYDPHEIPLTVHKVVPKLHELVSIERHHEVDFPKSCSRGFESQVQEKQNQIWEDFQRFLILSMDF